MSNHFINEQSVLGSLMTIADLSTDSAQKVFSMIKPGSFQDGRNREIFKVMLELEQAGTTADLIMVDSRLQQKGLLDQVGGISYLADLMQMVPSAANMIAYADLVRQHSIKTTVNAKIQNALAEFNDLDGDSVYSKLGTLESVIAALGQRAVSGSMGLTHIKEIAKEWVCELENRIENPEQCAGLSTGCESIDEVLGPKLIPMGSLVVLGARPKMGKSAMLEKICKSTALKEGQAVATFSLEMPNLQTYERMISGEAKVNSGVYHSGEMTEYQYQLTSEAIGRLNKTEMYIDDTPGIGLQHIKSESRKLAKRSNLKLIAVDYLTLMKAEKADRNDLAYAEITKGLKNLAKELNCVVLLLTQLNRNLEQRTDKRPIPADSRDTGSIEQDADLWIGLYREGVYNEQLQPEQKGLTEALVRLNRHGGTGTGYLNLTYGYFVDTKPFSFEQIKKERKTKDF